MAKGLFTPKNQNKYIGDVTKIRYLSSWELRFMQFLDNNPNVLQWASEEIKIGYYHPFKKRLANYIPDFLIKYRNKSGDIITEMIEIKPNKETITTKKTSAYDQAAITVNYAKWHAAEAYCKEACIVFRILTENQLFTK